MLSESFDNVVHVDCATIYQTADDKFFVIEGKNKCFAQLISSNHAQSKWSINENAIDTVKFIKEHTHVNLTDKYSEKIEENVKQAEETEKQNIIECLKNNEKESVTKRIEALTEKFKNNPAMLKVLAGVAAESAPGHGNIPENAPKTPRPDGSFRRPGAGQKPPRQWIPVPGESHPSAGRR